MPDQSGVGSRELVGRNRPCAVEFDLAQREMEILRARRRAKAGRDRNVDLLVAKLRGFLLQRAFHRARLHRPWNRLGHCRGQPRHGYDDEYEISESSHGIPPPRPLFPAAGWARTLKKLWGKQGQVCEAHHSRNGLRPGLLWTEIDSRLARQNDAYGDPYTQPAPSQL